MMTRITIPVDEKMEDAINAIRTAGREPMVFTDYQVGKGLVLVIFDDEQSKTKTKQCIVCGVFGEPGKLVEYHPSFPNWRAHPECKELDAKRGLVA